MKVLIFGCNQMTNNLVPDLAGADYTVTVLSRDRQCLDRIARDPQVNVILTTEPLMQDYLLNGGISTTDIFLALSSEDHQNALAAQIARHIFNVPKVICHLNDPQLQILYSSLGMDVVGYSFGLLQDIRQSIEK